MQHVLNGTRFTITDLVRAQRNRISGKRILFVHVPKCAGTSIDEAFMKCFGAYSLLTGRGMMKLEAVPSRRAAEHLGLSLAKLREAVLTYHLETRQFRYISGHLFISNRLFDRYAAEWDIVTVLREPVSRWLSAYFFNRFKSDRDHYGSDLPLEKFIDTPTAEVLGCTLVRAFLGSDFDGSPRSRRGIEQAKANLQRLCIVGFLEDLAGFATSVEGRYGVHLQIPRRRVNPHARYAEERQLSPNLLERVRQLCIPDIELYNFAQQMAADAKPHSALRDQTESNAPEPLDMRARSLFANVLPCHPRE